MAILLLVIVRWNNPGFFRDDAGKWAQFSVNGENVIGSHQLAAMENAILILLDSTQTIQVSATENKVVIDPEKITEKDFIKKLREFRGAKVLISPEPLVAAKSWMILSQLGVTNLYLLNDNNNEKLKYDFRPDTLIRPEI
jgi:hypothetical protein